MCEVNYQSWKATYLSAYVIMSRFYHLYIRTALMVAIIYSSIYTKNLETQRIIAHIIQTENFTRSLNREEERGRGAGKGEWLSNIYYSFIR